MNIRIHAALLCTALVLSSCSIAFVPNRFSWAFHDVDIDTITPCRRNIDSLRALYPDQPCIITGRVVNGWEIFKRQDPANYEIVRQMRYLILDPNDEMVTLLSESFKNDIDVVAIDVAVVHPDGSRYQLSLDDFTRTSYQENTQYRAGLKGLQRGTFVDVAYFLRGTSEYNFVVDEPINLRSLYPVEYARFDLQYPSSLYLSTRAFPDSAHVHVISADDGVYRLEAHDLAPRDNEPYLPPESVRRASVGWATLSWRQVDASEGGYWKIIQRDYHRWMEESGAARVEEEDLKFIDSLGMPQRPGFKDSLQMYTDWFRSTYKFDYYTVDGNQVLDVLDNQRGNVRAVASLAQLVYQRLGWNATVVWLHSQERGPLDPNFKFSGQFGEMALLVWHGRESYLVLIQRPDLPVDVVPGEYAGQPYLTHHVGSTEPIEMNPSYQRSRSVIDKTFDLDILADGSMRVRTTISFSGEAAVEERSSLKDKNIDEQQRAVRYDHAFDQAVSDSMHVEIEHLDEPLLPLVLRLTYRLPDAVALQHGEAVLQTGGLLSAISEQSTKMDTVHRRDDIFIEDTTEFRTHVTCSFPPTWKLVTALDAVQMHGTVGTLDRDVFVTSTSLEVKTTAVMHAGYHAPTKARELYALIGKRSNYSIPDLVFTTP